MKPDERFLISTNVEHGNNPNGRKLTEYHITNKYYFQEVLASDLIDWLDEQIIDTYEWYTYNYHSQDEDGNYFLKRYLVFEFQSKQDALMFKLAWG